MIREKVVEIARGELGSSVWSKYTDGRTADHPGSRVSWCGIFALWCLHQCGIGHNMKWIYGKGFAYRLPITSDPQPGDIAYIDKPVQHHAVVEKIVGNLVYTIDGNIGDKVVEKERQRGEFTCFFSIEPLLGKLSGDITPGLTPAGMVDADYE